jgi:hypothetical protein
MLALRVLTHAPAVDALVLLESTTYFDGSPRPLHLGPGGVLGGGGENWWGFGDKVKRVVIDFEALIPPSDLLSEAATLVYERAQRDATAAAVRGSCS